MPDILNDYALFIAIGWVVVPMVAMLIYLECSDKEEKK